MLRSLKYKRDSDTQSAVPRNPTKWHTLKHSEHCTGKTHSFNPSTRTSHTAISHLQRRNRQIASHLDVNLTDAGRRTGLCFGLYGIGLESLLHGTPSPTDPFLLRAAFTAAAVRAGDADERGGDDRMVVCAFVIDGCTVKNRLMSSKPRAMIPVGLCARSNVWPSSWSAAPRPVA